MHNFDPTWIASVKAAIETDPRYDRFREALLILAERAAAKKEAVK